MNRQFAACARKVPFATAADAEASGKGRLSAYLCPVCGRYHLTSKPAKVARKAEEAEVKPTFDRGVLGRAWKLRPRADIEASEEVAVCLGKPAPDGRVRVKVGRRELATGPVQPASARLQLRSGVAVRIRIKGSSAEFIALA